MHFIYTRLLSVSCFLSMSAFALQPSRTLQRIAARAPMLASAKPLYIPQRKLGDNAKPLLIVRHEEAMIIERLGKFHRVLTPGLRFKIPFIDSVRKIRWSGLDDKHMTRHASNISRLDLRELVHDIPNQKVITKDNVQMSINGLVYYKITDPEKATYGVQDLNYSLENLAQTTLRNEVGGLKLDATLDARGKINNNLRTALEAAAQNWGVHVTRVELKEINPPSDIQKAMDNQMKAERDQRATILHAEGEKQAAIRVAEGQKQSSILKAQGSKESEILKAEGANRAKVLEAEAEAQARFALAKAEADSIKVVQEAAPNQNPLAYLVAAKYIAALPEITKAGAGKTVVVPYDSTSLASATSMLKEVFTDK